MLTIVSALLFAIQVHAKSIVWKQGPPTMPRGARIAVLEGDPSKSGIFTLRIKFPAGAIVGPHWHPRPERVTLLSGRVMVGFGDVVDTSTTKTFRAGDFYVNPPDAHHFVVVPVETVVQVTGEGPWETHLLE